MERVHFFTMTCLAMLLAAPILPSAAAQGLLSKIRQRVRVSLPEEEDTSDDTRQRNRRSSYREFYDDEDDDDLFGQLIFGTLCAPIWLPPKLLHDDYQRLSYFRQHPYCESHPGYMMIAPQLRGERSSWSVQTRTEYGTNFDSMSRIGTKLLVDSRWRLGLDAEANYWHETLGSSGDNLWTGDINLLCRFAQSEWLQLRSGVGTAWIADDVGSDFGFNFTYQGDWFPKKPWIVSGELDLGKIGSATLVHVRVTTGWQLRRGEAFIGYDYYELGQVEVNGFVSGLRFWF